MSQEKGKKGPNGRGGERRPALKGKSSRVSWTLVGLAVGVAVAGIYFVFLRQGTSSKGTESADRPEAGSPDFEILVGKWMRPDGGYILAFQGVDPDGRVEAGYFNPRPINVSRAEASAQGKTIKLFIELQGVGYPGSTYELTYDPRNDVLFGIYFQAAMQQRFDVVFVRTK